MLLFAVIFIFVQFLLFYEHKKLPGIDTEQFILFTLSENTHNMIFGF